MGVIENLNEDIQKLDVEIDRLEAERDKYLNCLKMILRRDCCSPLNSPFCDGGDCDCVWERVCQTIDPIRWKEVQALQGKKGNEKLIKELKDNEHSEF